MADALDAVGDGTRRAILRRLVDGPRSVAELAEGMAVGRPAVSQHLKILRQAGLVAARAQGTRRLYTLDPRGAEALARYTQELWAAALGRFGQAVDDLESAGAGRAATPAAPSEGREDRP